MNERDDYSYTMEVTTDDGLTARLPVWSQDIQISVNVPAEDENGLPLCDDRGKIIMIDDGDEHKLPSTRKMLMGFRSRFPKFANQPANELLFTMLNHNYNEQHEPVRGFFNQRARRIAAENNDDASSTKAALQQSGSDDWKKVEGRQTDIFD